MFILCIVDSFMPSLSTLLIRVLTIFVRVLGINFFIVLISLNYYIIFQKI